MVWRWWRWWTFGLVWFGLVGRGNGEERTAHAHPSHVGWRARWLQLYYCSNRRAATPLRQREKREREDERSRRRTNEKRDGSRRG